MWYIFVGMLIQSSVPPGSITAVPGAPVTAVLAPDGVITLFLTDPGGIVYAASGNPAQGWGDWLSVLPSSIAAAPGAPITAVLAPDGSITLFLADPGGGVYTASGSPADGWGPWSSVSQGSTTPGARVTAVPAPDGGITLFLADPGGGVYTASGSPADGWGPWSSVSQGSTTPGAPITAILAPDGVITLFPPIPGDVTLSWNPAAIS